MTVRVTVVRSAVSSAVEWIEALVASQRPTVRLATVLAALLIMYVRTPITFQAPQMWGEDIDFFYFARVQGLRSLAMPVSGYLSDFQFVTALLAQAVSPIWAAAIYCYVSIAVTLAVVWLVTSPRLDFPSKPLLALAVVVVPMGFEEIGTITNVQWILPVGAFAMLFMSAPRSTLVVGAEAIYLLLMALSGPFSLFMAPMFVLMACRPAAWPERRRLIVLSAVVTAGALVQLWVVAPFLTRDLGIASVPYSRELWVTLPFERILTVFPLLPSLFEGVPGAVAGMVLLVVAVLLATRRPYRAQKAAMIFLAACIAVGGMLKFRMALGTQTSVTRYFYLGSIFVLWFICCLSARRSARLGLTAFVAATELALLPVVAATPRSDTDFEWRAWARSIDSGLPVLIPAAPDGFYLVLPAAADGPLARFSRWRGRDVPSLSAHVDPTICSGTLASLDELKKVHIAPYGETKSSPLWQVRGSMIDPNGSGRGFPVVALADESHEVVGFGFPGFRNDDPADTAQIWQGIFFSRPRRSLQAYAMAQSGTLCALGDPLSFPETPQPIASERFVEAVGLAAGRKVVQRVATKRRLAGLAATLVTWGRKPSSYRVDWRVLAHGDGRAVEIGSGQIDAGAVRDWQSVVLPITMPKDLQADEIEVSFQTDGNPVEAPIGLPLMSRDDDEPAAEVDGQPASSGGAVKLTVSLETP